MKRNSGQLAIGLAFSFATVLAMFLLVFQSSILTREKMKLQQTTDLAALVAGEVQRRNLNRIQELNEEIKKAYKTIKKWSHMKAVVYWDNIHSGISHGNNKLSEESWQALDEILADPYFIGGH